MINIAVSEEALGELADSSGKPDWTAALVTGRAVFLVPAGTKLAILDRNVLGWSVDHARHAGVALKVRVLDGEHAGQIGHVLAAWLKFLDPLKSQPNAAAPARSGSVDFDFHHVKINPSGMSDDNKDLVLNAAKKAVLRVHPGTLFNRGFQIAEIGSADYDVWLPVIRFDQFAKCNVRKSGQAGKAN